MKDTKMSICTTNANITGTNTIEEILKRIEKIEFKEKIDNLRSIVKEKGKEAIEYKNTKERLIGFIPSGIFGIKRSKESLESDTYTQIFVLDIDDLQDENHVIEVKNKVKALSHTLAVFISPSGKGCKILVKVTSTPDEHKGVYAQLMKFYDGEMADLKAKCDTKCADLSRFHYFSHDPDIYINWDSERFIPSNEEIAKYKQGIPFENNHINQNLIEESEKLTQKKFVFKEGRNTYVLSLACNLNRYKVEEGDALDYIVKKYVEAGFSKSEISTTVKGVYKRNKGEFGKFEHQRPSNDTKKYDYQKIREDLKITNIKFSASDYFSLLFQSNKNKEENLSFWVDDLDVISQIFEDVMLSYFSTEIIKNPNFENTIFSENEDASIRDAYQTLYNNEILPTDDRKRRILIADFKVECLNKCHYSLLKKQPFSMKGNIVDLFEELNQVSALAMNQIKISKSLLEDCFDNPL